MKDICKVLGLELDGGFLVFILLIYNLNNCIKEGHANNDSVSWTEVCDYSNNVSVYLKSKQNKELLQMIRIW